MKQAKSSPQRGKSAQKKLSASTAERIIQWLFWVRKGLLALMLVTVPVLFYLGNTEYGYTKSIFALITTGLLTIAWFTEMALRKNYRLRPTQLFWPGLALVISGFLSLISFVDITGLTLLPTLPIGLQTLAMLCYFGLLYFIMAHSIESERDLKLFLGYLLISAVPVCVYALLQYYGLVTGAQGVRGGLESVISTMGNRNYVASFLGHLLPITLVLFFQARLLLTRLAIALTLILLAYTLWIADSAAIWAGLAAAGVVGLMALFVSGLLKKLSDRQKLIFQLSLGILFIGAIVVIGPMLVRNWNATSAQSDPGQRLGAFVQKVWVENSGEVRLWDWWIGYEMWKASPLFGQGLGTYKIKFLEYKAIFRKTEEGQKYNIVIPRAIQAHNEYIQVLSEMGILGLTAMLALIGSVFVSAFRFVKLETVSSEKKWIAIGALAGATVFFVDSFFSFPLHLPASALNLVFLLGLLQSKWLQPELPEFTVRPRPARFALVLVALIALTVIVYAARDFISDTCLDSGQTSLQQGYPLVAKGDLECSVAYEFAPSDVYFEMGKLYDQFAARSSTYARESKTAQEHQLHVQERDNYFRLALDNFRKALIVSPNETVYFQVASLYLQQAADAKDEKKMDEAKRAFESSRKYLALLLDLQPDELLRKSALFQRDVMIPLAELDEISSANAAASAQQSAIAIVTQFIDKFPDYSQAYISRAEIYRQIAEGEIKIFNRSPNCARALTDLEKAKELINQRTSSVQARIADVTQGVRRAPSEVQVLRGEIDALNRERALINEILNNVSKLQC